MITTQAFADIVFYENEGFSGRSFTTNRQVSNLYNNGFNDRASSAIVLSDRWEVCSDSGFNGDCIYLRPGRYSSLDAMGMNNSVSSARMISGTARYDEQRYAPDPEPVYDNRRRNRERLYTAYVTSVRAVIADSGQRCWIERDQVEPDRSRSNVPGTVLGAVIGGVLGHQIGSGSGRDVATVGGAIAGGVIGSNISRDRNNQTYSRDVQHCSNASYQTSPDYWDVTYTFRGIQHRIQMTYAPGRTVTVNARGEPRAS
ncbi:beta/gamma crystallin-related protein [Leeia oryzae]|uniref:beta/gamma crystallin-related protein n=1 Tax=Leeia oryzae TaxID=356662 RepID=UPI002480ED75|nr:beta/gamma crystallin-related protein [Leeia oryzae]